MSHARDPKELYSPARGSRSLRPPAKGNSASGTTPVIASLPNPPPEQLVIPSGADVPVPNAPPAKRIPRAIAIAQPAAKRHPRRIGGEAPSPVPARKKAGAPRVSRPLPAKRMVLVKNAPAMVPQWQPRPHQPVCEEAVPAQAAAPSWMALLWIEVTGRLRAQWRRSRPESVILAQATARYHVLLMEQQITRPSV